MSLDYFENQAGGIRCVHYALAHRELPAAVFRHPEHVLEQLRTEEAREVLAHCWYGAARSCWDFSRGLPIRGDPRPSGNRARPLVRIQAGRIGRRPCVILEMPPPVAPAEASFVAIVGPAKRWPAPGGSSHGHEPAGPDRSSPRLRYFTLETGGPDRPASFLCEWTRDGRHANLGGGPRPDARAFSEAIGRRVHEAAAGSTGAVRVELLEQPRSVPLPGVLSLDGLSAGDLLDDLADSGLDPEIARIAYQADPESMIRRPWQVEALLAAGSRVAPALEASTADENRRPWAVLLLDLLKPPD